MSQTVSTTSHAVLADIGLNIHPDEHIASLQYDDGSSLLLLLNTSNLLFAYSTHPLPPPSPPASPLSPPPPAPDHLQWSLPLPDGPPPTTIRVSPDHTLLALQRSPFLIEFLSLSTNLTFVHGSHRGRSPILNFFFTDCREADLVLITSDSLEACQYVTNRQGFRLHTRITLPHLRWHRYTHETRVAAIGTGPTGSRVIAFQFTPTTLLRLAPLDLRPPGPARNPSPISPSDVWLLKAYSRVYLTYLDRDAMRLELHRYYTDAALLEASYDIFSPTVALLTVDNLLIAYHPDSSVALLLDVLADPSHPVANPLPLALLPPTNPSPPSTPSSSTAPSPTRTTSRAFAPAHPGNPHPPNIILNTATRTLYRAHLDLAAIACSCSDAPLLVAVLQRRRPSPLPPSQPLPRKLLLSTAKSALQERLPIPTLRRIFDHLTKAVSAATTHAVNKKPDAPAAPMAEPPPCAILTPDDVARHLFRWAHDEEVVDAPYLAAALTEYQISAQEAGVQLPPYLQLLAMEMLLQQGQNFQVAQALAIHPPLGSLFVAELLEDDAAASNAAATTAAAAAAVGCSTDGGVASGWPIGHLARDIHARAALLLRGGAAGDRYCRRLLTEDMLLRAARFMRNWGSGVPPQSMLEATGKLKDRTLMAAVYRQWAGQLGEGYPRFEQACASYLDADNVQEASGPVQEVAVVALKN